MMLDELQESQRDDDEGDHPRDACGVVGLFAPDTNAARMAFFALYALQHRGQESAGIATSDGVGASLHKDMGLVAQVFNEEKLRPLRGHLAIGHTRYSTTGSSNLRNAQPYLLETLHGPLGVGHNGNLTNATLLRRRLLERGVGLTSSSDSEVITQWLAAPSPSGMSTPDWEGRITSFMAQAEGAYALVILTRDAIYGVRDPHGFRPLCIGELPGEPGGWMLASESCALATVGARLVREVGAGEVIRLDHRGVVTVAQLPVRRPALCVFEYVYFSRPDSLLDNLTVHQVRQQLGEELAREAPAQADIVVAVPDSALPAAIGYARASGIPYSEGLIKNRYIGRTFIQPDDRLRRAGVRLKYNPLQANLDGKRVVVIDDSIVRGNTAGPLVKLLREGGAAEVHMRVSSPPVQHPCFMGVDMPTHSELIAHHMSVEEIRQHIGADSLAYLSLEGMLRAAGTRPGSPARHCTACFSGDYPLTLHDINSDITHDKLAFEQRSHSGRIP